jgi:hypothetical protein
MPPTMRIAGFLAALALLGAASPAAAQEWRLFHRDSGSRFNEIGYADLASIERSGRTVRLTVRGFAERRTSGPASVMMRLEMDCAGRRVRPLEARPLDSDDQQTHEIPIDIAAYRPMTSPAMQALGRLVCDGDGSASEAVPAGTRLSEHAAAVLAALRPPPSPEPPPLAAEEEEAMAKGADAGSQRRFERLIRRALAAQCGSDPRCKQLEAEIHGEVPPLVAVDDLGCEESRNGTFGRASCAFRLRHPRTGRRLSCTIELAESVGQHSRYWSYRTIRRSPPQPPSAGLAVPAAPPPGENSLRCSGSLLALVSD